MIEVKMNSMDGVVLMTAGKKIEENIKVTPVASLILPEYDGAYELLVPTVSGVWVFNETITQYTGDTVVVNFTTADGTAWIELGANDYSQIDGLIKDSDYGSDSMNAGTWTNEAWSTWDFGAEPQEVSEEFYAWLTANAVKQ